MGKVESEDTKFVSPIEIDHDIRMNKDIRRSLNAEDSIKNAKQYEKERIATERKGKRLMPIMDKFNCDVETAESIKKKEVWIGMTYEMLVYERGKPDNINRSNYGHREQYQACWMDWRPMCFYFDDSHVITAYN